MSNKAKNALLWLMIISSALMFVWFIQKTQSSRSPQELSLDQAIIRIKNRDFKEVFLKQSQIEFVDVNGSKFYTNIGSDPTRELILKTIQEQNELNPSSPIKFYEEQTSSGLFWYVLIQSLP
ncbi:MAG: ATP-dependent metallopeptidase FtsH/Yme1/Tma family protein, partial [Pyrinomonadaceae bacterium]